VPAFLLVTLGLAENAGMVARGAYPTMPLPPRPVMLRYFANGRIRWKNGMRCNTRTNWEFYAVIDGRCGAVHRDGAKPVLREKTLWVFAPECSHAWIDDGHHVRLELRIKLAEAAHP
jgi:hypothetical protein